MSLQWTEFERPLPSRVRILQVSMELFSLMLVGGPRLYSTNAPLDMRVVGWRAADAALASGYVEFLVTSAGFDLLKAGDDFPVLKLRMAVYEPEDLQK